MFGHRLARSCPSAGTARPAFARCRAQRSSSSRRPASARALNTLSISASTGPLCNYLVACQEPDLAIRLLAGAVFRAQASGTMLDTWCAAKRQVGLAHATVDEPRLSESGTTSLNSAEVLLREKLNLDAQYLGGYTVECSLKALILQRTSEPDRPAKLELITAGAQNAPAGSAAGRTQRPRNRVAIRHRQADETLRLDHRPAVRDGAA